MKQQIFITGFPGFLATEFLRKFSKDQELVVHALIQEKFLAKAKKAAEELSQIQFHFHVGDLNENFFSVAQNLTSLPLTDVFHFAAIYDLSIAKEIAYKVNVQGTENIIQWIKTFQQKPKLHYISTCYVSGRYHGLFTENDLIKGQSFNNFYEETKYLAEVLVQKEFEQGLSGFIYRPSIVVGNSQDGKTQKYDGPYFVIRWLLKQPGFAVLPVVGAAQDHELNVVPRDYLIDGMIALVNNQNAKQRVYQLADPAPVSVAEIIDLLEAGIQKKIIRLPLPLGLAKFSIDKIPGVYSLMEIPSHAVDYFVHPTKYRSVETVRALNAHGIHCPSFSDYSKKLIDFVRANPKIPSEAMY